MIVVAFWNGGRTVLLRKENRIIGFDRQSLEVCLGRGELIELEVGDAIQDKFDDCFVPKTYHVASWLEKKFLENKRHFKKQSIY